MNKFLRITGIVAILLFSLRLFTFFTYEPNTDNKAFMDSFNEKYAIYALPLPEDLTLAGEEVPFNDPDIYERFDRELHVNTYWQSQTILFFKRVHRYFPIIEPILKEHGIPEDFKYLALIESGLTNVVSPAGATGFWQILESTGKSYGLEINKEIDERYDIEKSTIAAAKYLKEAYEEFGSWTLAAASYNMGIYGVQKQLKRQHATDYYGLTLNAETSRYVFRIIALKEIIENPVKYGFHFREKDLYQTIPTTNIYVDTAIADLGHFANKMGINYRILKYHNPWLRYEYLPNSSHKTYAIKIPKKGYYWMDDKGLIPPTEEQDSTEVVTDSLGVQKDSTEAPE